MEINQELYYAKLQSLDSDSVFLKAIPSVLGSESHFKRKLRQLQEQGLVRSKHSFSYPLPNNIFTDDPNYFDMQPYLQALKPFKHLSKLVVSANPLQVAQCHALIKYNPTRDIYEILPFHPVLINGDRLNIQSWQEVKMYDRIEFTLLPQKIPKPAEVRQDNSRLNSIVGEESRLTPCLFYFILPSRSLQQLGATGADPVIKNTGSNNQRPETSKGQPKGISNPWNGIEKEQLKKYLLIFGYGRWQKIKQYSKQHCRFLQNKPDSEIKSYANAFLQTLIDYQPFEKNELKKFLVQVIDTTNCVQISTRPKEWGDQIKQRAAAWAKRIQLLHRVKIIIQKFKEERVKYFNKTEEEKKDAVVKQYENFENLLSFLPSQVFYGQRPSTWWTKQNDIDLLRGTYDLGYANYQQMRENQKFSFHRLEKVEGSFQEFPNADTITRRLKKLVQFLGKYETHLDHLNFETNEAEKEPSGFSLDEKNKIVELLIDFGIPMNSEGKVEWGTFKDKLMPMLNQAPDGKDVEMKDQKEIKEQKPEKSDLNVTNIERFVQRLRMVAQQKIEIKQTNQDLVVPKAKRQKTNEETKGESMTPADKKSKKQEEENLPMTDEQIDIMDAFDPDKDGFQFPISKAEILHKNINLLHYIRKSLICNNSKNFNQGVDQLQKKMKQKLNEGLVVANSSNENASECFEVDLPEGWKPELHDKSLLYAVAEQGFSFLKQFSENSQYETIGITISAVAALKRVEELCQFFKDQSQVNKVKKKKVEGVVAQSLDQTIAKKKLKINLNRDENGDIIYPIVINQSLRILNLGEICLKPNYCSSTNLFPIGFKSIREHASMIHPGKRCEYINEIKEGAHGGPDFIVECLDDPGSKIVRSSSTGCWIVICNKINDMSQKKRENVTISGPERFGISDPQVIKLLQQLPDVEKCSKYQMR